MPTKLEYAYLAGLIDGEGWLSSGKSEGIRANGKIWKQFYFRLGIKMTAGNLLKWVQDTFGGRLYKRNPDTGGFGGKKIQYSWEMSKREDLKKLIKKIRPYMKIKGPHFDLFLEYDRGWVDVKGKAMKQNIRNNEWDRRLRLKNQLTILNGGKIARAA